MVDILKCLIGFYNTSNVAMILSHLFIYSTKVNTSVKKKKEFKKNENKNKIRKEIKYYSHSGHSRTIIGVEQLRDGSITMLVLDPSHSPAQMAQFNNTSSALGAMRLVRKSIAAMKARQYQVVAVTGIMETDLEYHVISLI